jgi:threonine dehydrogenase-like Zn-dependent dehydrogenase
MKAVTWHGKRDVRVDTVPDPDVQEPTDAIIEVTSTNICGSCSHQPRCRRPCGDPVPNLLRQLLYVRSTALHTV